MTKKIKKTMFCIFALFSLIAFVQGVDANHDYYDSYKFNRVSPNFAYSYDNYYGTGAYYFSITPDRNYPYYNGYDIYVSDPYYRGFYFDDLDDLKDYLVKRKAIRFIERSAYSRYDIAFDKKSGEAFYYDYDNKVYPASNYRYRVAYDPRIDGLGSYKDYYYKPGYDPELGYYNWRF
ncbi:hypothetical protein HYV50_05075 [Candidatus Pacearchaeota archaeon]|nr:hypothetical protein [Candidatus Pacearchaeota archaeon]